MPPEIEPGSRYVRELLARMTPNVLKQPEQKLGLYPLGAEDVIMSRPLYELVLAMLERGTEDQQREVARLMRVCEKAPYQL